MTQARLILIALGSLLITASPAQAAKIKCWTNSDGIRECGNSVPPEYAQQGHDEINKQGVTTKRHERAKTPEELAEEKRIKAAEAEKQRLAKEQYERDRILLKTFSSEDEIVMTRDGKVTAIKTELRLTRKSMQNTKARLRGYQKQAANLERAGKPVNANLLNDIKTAEKQVADYEAFIASKEQEKNNIQDNFEKDMSRYKTLKGRPTSPTTTSTGK